MAPKEDAHSIPTVGERIVWHNTVGTMRYIGPVEGTKGTWLGVEWDDPSRGKHNGVLNGQRYFTPISSSDTAASFVRFSACSMGQSLLSVLRDLYPSPPEAPAEAEQAALAKGLSEPEVRRARAQAKSRTLAAQKTINLSASLSDGHMDRLVCRALDPTQSQKPGDLATAAPEIVLLNLSYNLFSSWDDVLGLIRELPLLQDLMLYGNRLTQLPSDSTRDSIGATGNDYADSLCSSLATLELGGTLVSLPDALTMVQKHMPRLVHLSMRDNQLGLAQHLSLPQHATLASLGLAGNQLNNWTDIHTVLTSLPALVQLDLSDNPLPPLPAVNDLPVRSQDVHEVTHLNDTPHTALKYDKQGRALKSLVLSQVSLGWTDIERLDQWVSKGGLFSSGESGVGIQSLQVDFGTVEEEVQFGQLSPADEQAEGMLRTHSWSVASPLVGRAGLVARLPWLQVLNHTEVSPKERIAAEGAWLVAAQRILLSQPPSDVHDNASAAKVLREPRLAELATKYDVLLISPSKPAEDKTPTLAASLLTLHVVRVGQQFPSEQATEEWGTWAAQVTTTATVQVQILPSANARSLRTKLVRALGVPRAQGAQMQVAVSLGGVGPHHPVLLLPLDERRPLSDLGVSTGDTLLVYAQ